MNFHTENNLEVSNNIGKNETVPENKRNKNIKKYNKNFPIKKDIEHGETLTFNEDSSLDEISKQRIINLWYFHKDFRTQFVRNDDEKNKIEIIRIEDIVNIDFKDFFNKNIIKNVINKSSDKSKQRKNLLNFVNQMVINSIGVKLVSRINSNNNIKLYKEIKYFITKKIELDAEIVHNGKYIKNNNNLMNLLSEEFKKIRDYLIKMIKDSNSFTQTTFRNFL